MEKMNYEQMVEAMKNMDNAQRLKFLDYLYEEHFHANPLTEEEMQLIDDLRDGYVKVVENE